MTTPRYVGFWYRLLAFAVDNSLWALLRGMLLALIYARGYAVSWSYVSGDQAGGEMADLVLAWLMPAVLTLLFWEYRQATPGKLLISARIVDSETRLPPSPEQWIIRYLGYFVSALPLGLGFLWIAFDSRKQGWHDKLAKTVVVFPVVDHTQVSLPPAAALPAGPTVAGQERAPRPDQEMQDSPQSAS